MKTPMKKGKNNSRSLKKLMDMVVELDRKVDLIFDATTTNGSLISDPEFTHYDKGRMMQMETEFYSDAKTRAQA